jgi:hypothetical protein
MAKEFIAFINCYNATMTDVERTKFLDMLRNYDYKNKPIAFIYFDDEGVLDTDAFAVIEWFGPEVRILNRGPNTSAFMNHFKTAELDSSDLPPTLNPSFLAGLPSVIKKNEVPAGTLESLQISDAMNPMHEDYWDSVYEKNFAHNTTEKSWAGAMANIRELLNNKQIFVEPLGEVLSAWVIFEAQSSPVKEASFANWGDSLPAKLK